MRKLKTDFDKVKSILDGNTTYAVLEGNRISEIKEIYFKINNPNSCINCVFDNNNSIKYVSIINMPFYMMLNNMIELYLHINTYEHDITDKHDNYFNEILKQIILYDPGLHPFNFTESIEINKYKNFMQYIKEENIFIKISEDYELSECPQILTYNRYNIPIEFIFIDNELFKICIHNKNNKDNNFINICDTNMEPMPCILISSLINYIIKGD